MLMDDSAAEQAAVRKAFPGLIVGETEVTHLLCHVHSMQALERQLKKHKCSHNHLLVALKYRRTSIDCDQSIDAAILATPDDSTEYIRNEWQKAKKSWAAYARQHSCLLPQVSKATDRCSILIRHRLQPRILSNHGIIIHRRLFSGQI